MQARMPRRGWRGPTPTRCAPCHPGSRIEYPSSAPLELELLELEPARSKNAGEKKPSFRKNHEKKEGAAAARSTIV